MKINVALFITALSTTAAASAGDDGAAAAAAATTVDRPHLRALLQTNKLMACPGYLDGRTNSIAAELAEISCDGSYCAPCGNNPSTNQFSNCVQQTLQDGDAYYYVKGCCTSPNNMNNCNGQNEVEDFIKANQDTTATTAKKLGDEIEEAVVPSSSTLRASSLLKNNVFTKQDGDETEDFLELAGCPAAGWNAEACPANYCADCNGKPNCQSKFIPCPQDSICVPERYYLLCCSNGGKCNGSFPDEEDAVMIKADEEEEVPQDTDKLDASSPLRASLLKVE